MNDTTQLVTKGERHCGTNLLTEVLKLTLARPRARARPLTSNPSLWNAKLRAARRRASASLAMLAPRARRPRRRRHPPARSSSRASPPPTGATTSSRRLHEAARAYEAAERWRERLSDDDLAFINGELDAGLMAYFGFDFVNGSSAAARRPPRRHAVQLALLPTAAAPRLDAAEHRRLISFLS